MRVELNIPPGERQQYFLDHLNANLRQKMKGYSGEAGFLEDGTYRSEVSGLFKSGDTESPLSFALVKSKAGVLNWIDVEPTNDDPSSAQTDEAARDFILQVLAAALSEPTDEFFFERLFLYIGAHLDGEYWLPGFRLAPSIPDDVKYTLINAERIASISFKILAIDKSAADAIGVERAKRYSARLSMLLNVGFYEPLPEQRWVIVHEDGENPAQGRRHQLGIAKPGIRLSSMPAKGEVCPLGQFDGSLDDRYLSLEPIRLPPESRRILRGFEALEPNLAQAIDRAARLYQVGLVVGRRYPSVSLAYRVAAIDTLVQASPQYSDFRDFMKTEVPDEPDLDEALDYLYGKARSAHFHSGEFPGGEFDLWRAFDPFMDDQWILRTQSQRLGYELTRVAIVNWMRSVMPELGEAKA